MTSDVAEKASGGVLGVIQPRGFPPLPQSWQAEAQSWTASDGKTSMFALELKNTAPATRRHLVIVHGFGEHGGRYLHAAHYLADTVDAIYCPDLRGHGRSGGLRGHIESFDELPQDVWVYIDKIYKQIKEKDSQAELHVLAHSLGGLIFLRALRLGVPAGITLSSVTISAPFLAVQVRVPVVKKLAAQVLRNIWGSLQLPTELDATLVSRDPEVVRAYREDRLVHDKMTPRFFTEVERVQALVLAEAQAYPVPVQFLVPMQDGLVQSQTSIDYFEQIQMRQKRLRTYAKCFHESFNEPEKEQAFTDLADWITQHGAKAV